MELVAPCPVTVSHSVGTTTTKFSWAGIFETKNRESFEFNDGSDLDRSGGKRSGRGGDGSTRSGCAEGGPANCCSQHGCTRTSCSLHQSMETVALNSGPIKTVTCLNIFNLWSELL